MVQPASKRLVTEQKLSDTLLSEIPAIMDKQKTRPLGDQFSPVKAGSVPSSKAVVSLTTGTTTDGFAASGYQLFLPPQMYDIAECNWNDQTLGNYGSSYMNKSKSHNTSTCFDFTTIFEGSYAVFSSYKLAGVIQDLRIWIDDVEVTDWYLGTRAAGVLQTGKPEIPCVTDNTNYYLNVNFPKRGIYKIRVAGTALAGTISLMACNAEGKFYKPKKQRVFGVISDSWYDTISGTNTSLNNGVEISSQTGWKQWNLAVGGSGFVNPSNQVNGPHQYGSDAVFGALAKAPELDLLILNGSVNDMGYTEAEVLQAMRDFFTRWRTVRPDTPIVWQGLEPQSYFESVYTSAAIIAREEAQRAVAMADENVIGVILPAKENWLTGTGKTTAPNGTGNQDFVTGPDGIHPSVFGCRQNGVLVSERLAPIPTWKGVS